MALHCHTSIASREDGSSWELSSQSMNMYTLALSGQGRFPVLFIFISEAWTPQRIFLTVWIVPSLHSGGDKYHIMPPTGLLHYALGAHSSSTLPQSSMTASRGVGTPPPFSHSGTHCGVLVEAAMNGEWPEVGLREEPFIPGVKTRMKLLLCFHSLFPSGGAYTLRPCIPPRP